MYTVYSYFVYLAISIGLTVWVARTLHRNGRVFLIDAFHGSEPRADSVNHLLVVGFYLISKATHRPLLHAAPSLPATHVAENPGA